MTKNKNSPSVSPAAGLPARGGSLEELAKDMPNEVVDEMDLVIDEQGDLTENPNPDGSVDIILGKEQETNGVPHDANLAEHLDETEMDTLALDLMEKIEHDKKARSKRDEQYEEGIRRTGLGNDAPGGASFAGASKVVHPLLIEACIDFAAATMKELYPPAGPAKVKTEGRADPKKFAVATRQQRYLNWQLTKQISEYADELEQCLTQLPLGGSQYMKFWYDATLKRISCEFVPIDDVLLPFAASDFYSAQRITHVQRLTQFVFEDRVESEFYRDIDVLQAPPSQTPETTKAEQANQRVEGKDSSYDNIDGERIVFEVSTFAKLSIDKHERLPYLISIDEHTKKIVAIYRNWDAKDQSRTRLEWMVEYGFLVWRGAYKIGLPHVIGGLSAAATGALRALLDSGHFNNMPGFLRLKGARMGGQNKTINPAEGVEIEASAALDDIRKVAMSLPYNSPSPVLFELLGWLTDAGKGVVTTAEERIKDATNQMPVGTALALIEQGAKVFSNIFSRMHRSQARAFDIISRLNKKHLSMGEQLTKLGEVLATRNDFAEPLAASPVSDPNIFSETQRFAQMQIVFQLATGVDPKTGAPTPTAKLHNLYEAVKAFYEIAKIPDYQRFLPEPERPQEANAAAENMMSMMGRPLMAFPDQDHFAHIEAHMRFVIDPFLGGSGMAAQMVAPMMMEHVKQHMGYLYMQLIAQVIQSAAGVPIDELMEDRNSEPYIDKLIAYASKIVHAQLQQRLAPLGPVINGVLQQIAQSQMPGPMDPAQAVLMAEKMKQEGKRQETQKKLEHDAQKTAAQLAEQARAREEKAAIDQQKIEAQREKTIIDATIKQDAQALQADIKGAELERDAERMLHEAAERDIDREEARAGRESDLAMQLHMRDRDDADRFADREHQASMSEAERQFQASQKDSERQFQAGEKDKDRSFQARSKAADFIAADADRKHSAQVQRESETRKLKAQDASERRKLDAQERLSDKALKAKQQQAKSKPEGGKKK